MHELVIPAAVELLARLREHYVAKRNRGCASYDGSMTKQLMDRAAIKLENAATALGTSAANKTQRAQHQAEQSPGQSPEDS